ncbi:MAG: hypothetical protein HOV80_07075 [Polyangiaceae bacterium]|nr:hypothetical protein [Polyangiaceae bacterium]
MEALEREVTTMKAQLNEIRLRVTPDDELTDSEFEDRLKKELATLDPARRAQIERMKRSQRKTRGWTDEDVARYWMQRFEAEKVDAKWAKQIEGRCIPSLRENAEIKLERFECRTERCIVVVTAKEPNDVMRVIQQGCWIAGRHTRKGDDEATDDLINMGYSMLEMKPDAPSGTIRMISMLFRPGADMIPL